jgi:hypothetical protein
MFIYKIYKIYIKTFLIFVENIPQFIPLNNNFLLKNNLQKNKDIVLNKALIVHKLKRINFLPR